MKKKFFSLLVFLATLLTVLPCFAADEQKAFKTLNDFSGARFSTYSGSIALQMLSPDEQSISIINPAYLAATEGDCPVFHSAAKVRYARGFVKMLSGLTVHQANALRQTLEHDFGHTRYFRLRAGERLIDPATQEHIRQAMTRLGITDLPDFDAYVEEYDW